MNTPGLRLAIPWYIALALAVFILTNLAAIDHMRGVADPQGYPLNTAKLILVNTNEDDAQVSIGHALDLFGPVVDTFSIATNFGGPLLFAARPVMWLALELGIIKRSPDRYFYVAYPGELLKIWQVFAVYKLAILLLLPLALYWIGRNFLSESVGTIAAWLVVAMPFVTAFELRLKPDGVVLALTLLVLLELLQYVRSGRDRNLYFAAALLGLSFAMKFTLAPAVFLFPWAAAVARQRRGLPVVSARTARLGLLAGGLALAVFCLSNVRFLECPRIFWDFIFRYTAIPQVSGVPHGLPYTLWFQLGHFAPFFGPTLNVLFLPALLYAAWRFGVGRGRLTASSLVLVLFVLNLFYLWKVAHNLVVLDLTYYYYSQAVLALFLVAMLLGAALDARPGLWLVGLGGVAWVVLATFAGQREVLAYLRGPSTRQTAQAWVTEHLPKGTAIGLSLPRDKTFGFSGRYMLDPFAYRVVPVDPDFGALGTVRPPYVLAARMDPLEKQLADPAYQPLVTIYTVNGLRPGRTPVVPASPGAVEAALGAFLRQDAEPDFSFLSYQGLSIFPISLTLWRKTPETVLPLPGSLFTSALRDASSPVAYVHQIPPEVLTLWGASTCWPNSTAPLGTTSWPIPRPTPCAGYPRPPSTACRPRSGCSPTRATRVKCFSCPIRIPAWCVGGNGVSSACCPGFASNPKARFTRTPTWPRAGPGCCGCV